MSDKKGPFGALIRDAISNMDGSGDSQKAVNVRTDDKTRFNEKAANMQRGYLDFSSGLIDDKKGRAELSGKARVSSVDYIKWFSEINNRDVKIAGGKGASLGEMFNNKFPVPPGFVVTAQSFEYLINKAGLKEKIKDILSEVDYEDIDELNKASAEIRRLIENSEMPADLRKEILESYHILGSEKLDGYGISEDALTILKNSHEPIFVSVRSSATTEDLADASFAGQQESFLNVKGDGKLIEMVMRCFSSLYTPRAIYYRKKKGFSEGEALLAVVVQKMVDSEKSGVVFSKNPVGDENDVAIEAVFGLGEGIVSGRIKPDHYVTAKDLEIKSVKVADKKIAVVRTGSGENGVVKLSPEKSRSQVLSRGEIKEIADYAIKLENHYKKPQDIEFALERGEVYIVQSRPITTLGGKEKENILSGNIILEGQSASPGVGVGIVKIVKSMSDLSKIKKGDVLVTEMTNPDMVVAMQKSVAIVTDEGGMTCFSGDTKVLTNKGFIEIKDATESVNSGDEIILLAYDSKNMRPIWKKVIAAGKRKSKVIRTSISQTGRIEDNTLDLTPDHKMITFENRELIKREMKSILDNNEYLCLIDTLPVINRMNNEKLAYLMGAILSDGSIKIDFHHTGNPRRGRVTFTQKDVPEKEEFVNIVRSYFEDCFGESFSEGRLKYASSNIRGQLIQGVATDHISYKLKPALEILKISQNLDSWIMRLDDASCLNFLAGLIDGDGCFYDNRLHIYINKENVLQGVILACLNLGIFPQITKNRNIHHVQILEKLDEVLDCTNRVKGDVRLKMLGNKLFSAKQTFGDIIEEVNFKGRIKPYVDNNLLIDSRKIKRDILDVSSNRNKEELLRVLQSGLRMQRVKKICDIGEVDVYNLEIEADNELDHNFVVFTKKYTPLLVSNSHASIVSREMGIPCIVGTDSATSVLKDGMKITVDGSSGKIYEGEVAETKTVEIKPAVETSKIKLKVIVDLPDFAERAAETGIDSVGLTRLEGIIASMKKHPLWYEKNSKLDEYSKIIEKGLMKIMEYFKSVWFRASDLRSDEYSSLDGAPEKEINPMLGFHGVRFSLKHPSILKAELEAMKRVASANPDKKIGIMFPQVISIEEVREAKKYFNEVKSDNMEFGVMIETPASVQVIEEICDEVDFVSFGTNDLTQYTLAVDRNNEDVQYLYDEMHPAIYSQIEKVIDACNSKNVETSICGQAGSKKEMVEFLFKKGISSISVNADAAYEISELVKGLEEKYNRGGRERLERFERGRGKFDEKENFELKKKEDNAKQNRTDEQLESLNVHGKSFQKEENLDNMSDDELRKKLWKLKKQRRWKEFNNLKREMKKKGLLEDKKESKKGDEDKKKWNEGKKDGWNKKAQLGDLRFKDEGRNRSAGVVNKNNLIENTEQGEVDVEEIEKQAGEEESISNIKEDILLKNKKIEAEMQEGEKMKENIGPIEPFDSTKRIEDIGEEIQEQVHRENKEEIEEEKDRAEKNIEVSEEEVEEPEENEEVSEENENEIGADLTEDIEVDNPSQEDERDIDNITQDEEDEGDKVGEEDESDSSEDVEEESEGEIGSDSDLSEDIGVYNPDEEDEGKQKFKYNFEDLG